MDSTFFIFLELLAVFFFLFGVIREGTWQGFLIFLSTVFFFALSIASFDIEKTYAFLNQGTGEIVKQTFSSYDTTYAYLNSGLGLLSLAIGFIMVIVYRDSDKQEA
jgi:glucan phosphoethanolaminetransferase (alkaline phosphatase superfamily)